MGSCCSQKETIEQASDIGDVIEVIMNDKGFYVKHLHLVTKCKTFEANEKEKKVLILQKIIAKLDEYERAFIKFKKEEKVSV